MVCSLQEVRFRYTTDSWLLLERLRSALWSKQIVTIARDRQLLQVVLCSFVYGGSKLKNKSTVSPNGEQNSELQPGEKPVTPASAVSGKNPTPNSGIWPNSRPEMRDFQTEIDLMRG